MPKDIDTAGSYNTHEGDHCVCAYCGKPIRTMRSNTKTQYRVRTNRIDVEQDIPGAYRMSWSGEREPVTHVKSYHYDCWRHVLRNGWERVHYKQKIKVWHKKNDQES